MSEASPRQSTIPLAASDIVFEAIHGQKVASRIDARVVAHKALGALLKQGWVLRLPCPGCCNCAPSNYSDPLCDGSGDINGDQ